MTLLLQKGSYTFIIDSSGHSVYILIQLKPQLTIFFFFFFLLSILFMIKTFQGCVLPYFGINNLNFLNCSLLL